MILILTTKSDLGIIKLILHGFSRQDYFGNRLSTYIEYVQQVVFYWLKEFLFFYQPFLLQFVFNGIYNLVKCIIEACRIKGRCSA